MKLAHEKRDSIYFSPGRGRFAPAAGKKYILSLFSLVALSACGLREPLAPPPGASAPPAPAMASRPLTPEEMLTPPPIARPERAGEPLRRSEARRGDRFDLPPADAPSGEDPVRPEEDEPDEQPD